MPVSKSRFKRKKPKHLDRVAFEVDFAEGTFELPDQKHMPIKVARRLTGAGDLDALITWLQQNGADDDTIDFLDELDQGEMNEFMEAWQGASRIPAGK